MAISKKRPKILVYGNLFGAYRSQNLIKYLLDSGYRISLILPEFYYERGEKKDVLTKLLRLVFSTYYLVNLFIGAALADVVYLLPLNSDLIGPVLLACRLFRTRLVVEMYISSYDTLVREKAEFPINSRGAKRLKQRDALALAKADCVVHLSRYELNYWEKLLDVVVEEEKIWVAPLFCESDLLRFNWKAVRGDSLRICWWGTLLPTHGLENIVLALQILKAVNLPFTCQLFGMPPTGKPEIFEAYKTKIEAMGLTDVVCLRQDLRFSNASLPQYLVENCDLALGLFGNSEKAQAAVPNKLIEALVMGIPSLTMKTPALNEFFDPVKDFWVCDPYPADIARTITQIFENTLDPVNWSATRKNVLDTFSLDTYRRVIGQVIDGKS